MAKKDKTNDNNLNGKEVLAAQGSQGSHSKSSLALIDRELLIPDEKTKLVGGLTKEERKLVRQNKVIDELVKSDEHYGYLFNSLIDTTKERVVAKLKGHRYTIVSNAPIICNGPAMCPFFHVCPLGNGCKTQVLYDNDTGTSEFTREPLYDPTMVFPVGDQCILERTYLEQRIIDYINELDVDPARTSELSLVNDLALIDLHKNRCINIMAAGDKQGDGIDFLKVEMVRDGKTGILTEERIKEHPLLNVLNNLDRKKMSILDSLTATRKQKAQLAAKFAEVKQSSKLLEDIEQLKQLINETKNVRVINAADMINTDTDIDNDRLQLD